MSVNEYEVKILVTTGDHVATFGHQFPWSLLAIPRKFLRIWPDVYGGKVANLPNRSDEQDRKRRKEKSNG